MRLNKKERARSEATAQGLGTTVNAPNPSLTLCQRLMLEEAKFLLFLEPGRGVFPPNRRTLAALVRKGLMVERVPGHFQPTDTGREWLRKWSRRSPDCT